MDIQWIKRLIYGGLCFTSCLCADLIPHLKVLEKQVEAEEIHSLRNIDFVYLLNLDRRPEKWKQSIAQLNPYGIQPYRVSAIDWRNLSLATIKDVGLRFESWMNPGIKGATFEIIDGKIQEVVEGMAIGETYFAPGIRLGPIAIALSHLSILYDALQSGYQTIWVMEDDIDVLGNPLLISDLIEKLDAIVGDDGWDILFTDVDFRNEQGEYVRCIEYAPRPNFNPEDPSSFALRTVMSDDFSRVGARYGCHSMILRRSGIEKIFSFFEKYSLFSAIDIDYILPEGIRLFCLNYDLISQLTNAISDNYLHRSGLENE